MGSPSQIKSIGEYLLYILTSKLETSQDQTFLYSLSIGATEFKVSKEDFGEEINKIPDFDPEPIFTTLDDLGEISNNLLSLEQIQKVIDFTEEQSDIGLMFFYGGTQSNK